MRGLFAGQSVDGTAVLVRLTRYGDSDLDLDVDLNDLGNLASNFGSTSNSIWAEGDFDYDNDVDLPDLGSLATYFNTSGLPARRQPDGSNFSRSLRARYDLQ